MAPLATENVTVWDDNIGIHRKVIAGQEIPPDLVDAYNIATGGKAGEQPGEAASPAPVTDWSTSPKEDLEAEVEARGLTVAGTGANGGVVKDDLVAALQADDAK